MVLNRFIILLLTFMQIFFCASNNTKKSENELNFSSLEIDKIAGKWVITEYCGTTRQEHIIPEPLGYNPTPEEIEAHNKKYLNFSLIIEPNKVEDYSAPSEMGFYYSSEDLYELFRIPITINSDDDILYIELKHSDFENNINFIFSNDKAVYVNIDNYYYKLKKLS